jgi:hypothetical protein
MREGEVLPEDTLAAYNTACPKRAAELAASGSTEAIKMSQMQFLLRIVLDDVTAATRNQMLREFFGIKGILAGMTETERSSKFVYVRDPTRPGAPKELFIVSASALSSPDPQKVTALISMKSGFPSRTNAQYCSRTCSSSAILYSLTRVSL